MFTLPFLVFLFLKEASAELNEFHGWLATGLRIDSDSPLRSDVMDNSQGDWSVHDLIAYSDFAMTNPVTNTRATSGGHYDCCTAGCIESMVGANCCCDDWVGKGRNTHLTVRFAEERIKCIEIQDQGYGPPDRINVYLRIDGKWEKIYNGENHTPTFTYCGEVQPLVSKAAKWFGPECACYDETKTVEENSNVYYCTCTYWWNQEDSHWRCALCCGQTGLTGPFEENKADAADICAAQIEQEISSEPSVTPTNSPVTEHPSLLPSGAPSKYPTQQPTSVPTYNPTDAPTSDPTDAPTSDPTRSPSLSPSTEEPSFLPSAAPSTTVPTKMPSSSAPTRTPSFHPTTDLPTSFPTTGAPSQCPSINPSKSPSTAPTAIEFMFKIKGFHGSPNRALNQAVFDQDRTDVDRVELKFESIKVNNLDQLE